MNIYLDMDGVIADWDGSVEKLVGKPRSEISKRQVWKAINKKGFDFWANLDPYPWAMDLVMELKALGKVTICSSPSHDPMSVGGKLEWLQKFFGRRNFRDFIFTPQKHLLSRRGDFLIDDREKHADSFSAGGGTGILFPQPWNRNKDKHDRVQYTLKRIK